MLMSNISGAPSTTDTGTSMVVLQPLSSSISTLKTVLRSGVTVGVEEVKLLSG